MSDDESQKSPSDIAKALMRLRESSFDAVKRREHLPQPLFWSLFRTEITEIKRKKELRRLVSSLFDSLE